jgi:4-amino-4-deoxy-L-arabinose transferase-like glycosyltransferase
LKIADKHILVIGWLVFLLLAYFPLFLHLDSAPIKIWDESLFAMRAYYMAIEGAYLPNFDYFPGITSYPNLKPPLGTLFQAISFHIVGFNELGLRLPVALFALATILLMIRISRDFFSTPWAGMIAGLVLITSTGYISPHVARTGDHDAMLAFWSLLSLYFFYLYQQQQRNTRYLWALVATLVAGFLTKSVVVFFFIPGFIIYLFINRQLLAVLKDYKVYIAAAVVVSSILLYYWLMERYAPGFWKGVSKTVLGRYTEERNQQSLSFLYYVNSLATKEFFPWIFLLLLNLYQLITKRLGNLRALCMLLWCAVLSHLLIISCSATRLSWYEAAVYPALSLLAGISLFVALKPMKVFSRYATLILSVIVFASAYYQIVYWATHYQLEQSGEKMGYVIQHLQKKRPDIKQLTIYAQEFNGQTAFYSQVLNKQKEYDIEVMTYWDDSKIAPGGYLLLYREDQRQRAEEEYQLELVYQHQEASLYRIKN